jgi:hypothetical protein
VSGNFRVHSHAPGKFSGADRPHRLVPSVVRRGVSPLLPYTILIIALRCADINLAVRLCPSNFPRTRSGRLVRMPALHTLGRRQPFGLHESRIGTSSQAIRSMALIGHAHSPASGGREGNRIAR